MNLCKLNPLKFSRVTWPWARFYDKQREIIMSVEENDETYVTAGNQLGKDFVAGCIVPNLFLRCLLEGVTCRIVTTSVAEHHLKVLWGEVGRFVANASTPLIRSKDAPDAPLAMNYMELRRAGEANAKNPLNYAVGRVSEKGEGLAGHHANVTLFVADEASGVDDRSYGMAQGWAKRKLIFGNPNPCANFFFRGVKAGDLRADQAAVVAAVNNAA